MACCSHLFVIALFCFSAFTDASKFVPNGDSSNSGRRPTNTLSPRLTAQQTATTEPVVPFVDESDTDAEVERLTRSDSLSSLSSGSTDSCSSVSQRFNPESMSPVTFREALEAGETETILQMHPTQPLSNRGRSPLALLFEQGRRRLAYRMMTQYLLRGGHDEFMDFITIAINSRNPDNLRCVFSALDSAAVAYRSVLQPLVPFITAAIRRIGDEALADALSNILRGQVETSPTAAAAGSSSA